MNCRLYKGYRKCYRAAVLGVRLVARISTFPSAVFEGDVTFVACTNDCHEGHLCYHF